MSDSRIAFDAKTQEKIRAAVAKTGHGCRYPCRCDQFDEEHCACMDGHQFPRTDEAVCTFCQIRDRTGTAAHYHPDTRYPSCGHQGCGIDYRVTPTRTDAEPQPPAHDAP